MRDLLAAVVSRFQRARDVSARVKPGPLLVRAAVWALTAGAFLLAYPGEVVIGVRGTLVAVIIALIPAALPRTRMVSLVLFAIVVGWVIATTVYGHPITAARLLPLAALLYLMHTTAALAAVLPYDTVVVRGVFLAWFLRAVPVVVVSAIFGLVAVVGADRLGGQAYLAAAIGGVALVCVTAWLLVRAARG
jgi:hypothetical protein